MLDSAPKHLPKQAAMNAAYLFHQTHTNAEIRHPTRRAAPQTLFPHTPRNDAPMSLRIIVESYGGTQTPPKAGRR